MGHRMPSRDTSVPLSWIIAGTSPHFCFPGILRSKVALFMYEVPADRAYPRAREVGRLMPHGSEAVLDSCFAAKEGAGSSHEFDLFPQRGILSLQRLALGSSAPASGCSAFQDLTHLPRVPYLMPESEEASARARPEESTRSTPRP